jgi:hypothetical protein
MYPSNKHFLSSGIFFISIRSNFRETADTESCVMHHPLYRPSRSAVNFLTEVPVDLPFTYECSFNTDGNVQPENLNPPLTNEQLRSDLISCHSSIRLCKVLHIYLISSKCNYKEKEARQPEETVQGYSQATKNDYLWPVDYQVVSDYLKY